jgi:putative nucleotidyltransferase with HDIG domain
MQKKHNSAEENVLDRIDGYIAQADHLPPAPVALTQLLTLLREPNTDSNEIINVLVYDPSLTATVLKLSNSAFFAGSEPVKDLGQAVVRLGFAQIYQLVAVVCWTQSLAPARSDDAYGLHLWTHSVASAIAAEILARDFGEELPVAFTAGLLHDIGKVVLADALGSKYVELSEDFDSQQPYPVQTEKELLGVEHCEVGGRLLARWKFPAPIVAAVWNHHNPAKAKPHQKLAALIYWGDMIASNIENFQSDGKRIEQLAEEQRNAFPTMAPSPEQFRLCSAQVLERLVAARTVLGLNG